MMNKSPVSVYKGIVLGVMENGVQSLPADEIEEGDQSFLWKD